MLDDPDNDEPETSREPCECDEAHTVAKLGHCRDCPAYRRDQATMIDRSLMGGLGCPPGHVDGTAHDFGWATYSDERSSYGVCRCGYDDLAHGLMTLP